MTAFNTRRPTSALPDMSTPDLNALRRIRVRVTRTRIVETRPTNVPDEDRPSSFSRTLYAAALKDFAGLAILALGGYMGLLVI